MKNARNNFLQRILSLTLYTGSHPKILFSDPATQQKQMAPKFLFANIQDSRVNDLIRCFGPRPVA